ncbi:hypothetical protein BLS_000157 [Venturia inaequalis]|uniref:NADAR domain-containing protein n=1 Tax=Venturia inaequalis TaxID=5025 RepID=A0A8H3Z353_VENIN|nr:hypothetical protein BLS_000157 [Venturia inaequalis]
MVNYSKNSSGPVRDTDARKARAEAAVASKSTTGMQRDDDTDPSMPVFFYMPNEHPYGVFCQWQQSYFTVARSSFSYLERNALPGQTHDPSQTASTPNPTTQKQKEETITFSCCEQYMMYCKALFFQDTPSAKRILSTSSPKEQKAMGRSVKGFNEYEWSFIRQKVGEEGNYAKFTQNKAMRRVLLGTRERMIFEAARRDDIWGIGMDKATAVATWKALGVQAGESWGGNILGKAIMDVRARILREIDGGRGWTGEDVVGDKVKSEREKKVRSLGKRLRDIEVLKGKRDAGGKLQPNQIEKIEKEGELRVELEELGVEAV